MMYFMRETAPASVPVPNNSIQELEWLNELADFTTGILTCHVEKYAKKEAVEWSCPV